MRWGEGDTSIRQNRLIPKTNESEKAFTNRCVAANSDFPELTREERKAIAEEIFEAVATRRGSRQKGR